MTTITLCTGICCIIQGDYFVVGYSVYGGLHKFTQIKSLHRFTLLRQDIFDVLLAIHVGEPIQIVGNQMIVGAIVASHDDDTFVVRQFRDNFAVSCAAHFARIRQMQFWINFADFVTIPSSAVYKSTAGD